MENEIARTPATERRQRRSPSSPGEPVATGQVICVVAPAGDATSRSSSDVTASAPSGLRGRGGERAARRDREPDRPLAARRVPGPLGPRRARRQRCSRRRCKEHLRDAARAARRARASSSSSSPSGAARRRRMLYVGTRRPGEERLLRARVRATTTTCSDVDFVAALSGGGSRRPGRASALRRLHARQARPVLREVRPAALRRAPQRTIDPAGSGSPPTSAATASPATSSCCRRASTSAGSTTTTSTRCSTSYADGRIDLDRYRGRSAYTFPVQAAERAVARRRGLARHRRPRARAAPRRRARRSWRVALPRRARRLAHEVDVARRTTARPSRRVLT